MPPGPDPSLVGVLIILISGIDRLQDCEMFCNEIILIVIKKIQKKNSSPKQLIDVNKVLYFIVESIIEGRLGLYLGISSVLNSSRGTRKKTTFLARNEEFSRNFYTLIESIFHQFKLKKKLSAFKILQTT